ncbi:hypothetical protein SAMN05446589_7376 [Streptomyces sp. OV198]|uniref:hypothetical protein n=1 Tax=Streptomyces sp. OV198 TaxID=1882787 RepID=UPI000BD055B0|nr:hypothetical protein [Streptomyces sp. OV198]SOE77638.1 hypothetical protein SAMN05446589_7376 [Streptomyces sp. OV198]
MLKRVGFYEEADDVLQAMKRPVAVSDEGAVVRYLKAGSPLVVTGSWDDDLLDPDSKRISQYMIHTDGVWIWPSTLVYYFVRYRTELPDEFLRHMAASGWTVPTLDEAAMDAIVDQFMLEESVDREDSN